MSQAKDNFKYYSKVFGITKDVLHITSYYKVLIWFSIRKSFNLGADVHINTDYVNFSLDIICIQMGFSINIGSHKGYLKESKESIKRTHDEFYPFI